MTLVWLMRQVVTFAFTAPILSPAAISKSTAACFDVSAS